MNDTSANHTFPELPQLLSPRIIITVLCLVLVPGKHSHVIVIHSSWTRAKASLVNLRLSLFQLLNSTGLSAICTIFVEGGLDVIWQPRRYLRLRFIAQRSCDLLQVPLSIFICSDIVIPQPRQAFPSCDMYSWISAPAPRRIAERVKKTPGSCSGPEKRPLTNVSSTSRHSQWRRLSGKCSAENCCVDVSIGVVFHRTLSIEFLVWCTRARGVSPAGLVQSTRESL